MYASTISPSPRDEAKTLAGTFRLMWRVMLVVACYWLLQWGSLDLMQAFFRSMVVCGPPMPINGACPVGSVGNGLGQCEAVPKSSRDWSGSGNCADKAYVVSQSTAWVGKVASLGNLAMITSQVFVGAAMLDTLGRKPVVLMGVGSMTLLTATLWFASHLPSEMAMSIILMGAVVAKLADSFMAGALAMVSDLSQGDRQRQGTAFAMLNILRHAGILAAFGAGFPVLSLYLTDYRTVWALMLALSCGAMALSGVVLRESHGMMGSALLAEGGPQQLEGGGSSGGSSDGSAPSSEKKLPQQPKVLQMGNAMAETAAAFRLVWEDHYLRRVMGLGFLTSCAAQGTISVLGGFGLGVVKLRQQVVSLCGVAQPVAVALGSMLSAHLMGVLGETATFLLGSLVQITGYIMIGLAAQFHHSTFVTFWIGAFILGAGWGLMEPAYMKIVSRGVRKENYGKVFSAKMFMENLGICIGGYVWSNFVFASHVTGSWRDGRSIFLSAALQMAVFAGMSALGRVQPEQQQQQQQ